MKASLVFSVSLLFSAFSSTAQTTFRQQNIRRTDTQSVVILPEAQRQQIDTASIRLEKPKRKHRRFGVKIVPAPPPGTSRQELRYTDSMVRYR